MGSWMHRKATWRNKAGLCLAAAALLPLALAAQSNSDQPPQAGSHAGFPGWHGQRNSGNQNPNSTQNPTPNSAPHPVTVQPTPPPAKPSAAIPVSQLPAMPVQPVAPPTPPPPPPTPAQKPADRATVNYAHGLLTVKANNSSLNQILRAIMRQTGLQINGGVTEERVYGVYGPAPMQVLLANLLDGSGTNILYMPAADGQPSQLTLTPRGGGASPPPPSASASDDLLPPPAATPAPDSGQLNSMQPNLTPQPGLPAPATVPQPTAVVTQGLPPAAIAPAVTPTPAVATLPGASAPPVAATPPPPANTGHTAEDLVQQILQMRAAQQKAAKQPQTPAAPAPAPAATPATAPAITPK